MKVLLDACVLYPTILREILIGVAGAGLYAPLWSERILEEWARATRKLGPEAEMLARGDIARLRADWPDAAVLPHPGLAARLHLPDENDIHVLAAAVAGHADAILTFNASDFPRRILAEEGIERRDPDGGQCRVHDHASADGDHWRQRFALGADRRCAALLLSERPVD